MRQSNLYILLYATALTIVCGGILAFAATSLKDKQDANIALEQKKNILSSVIALEEDADIEGLYARRVKAYVIDAQGNVQEGMTPEQVVVAAEYKKACDQRLLPVYEFRSESDPDKVEYAVMPVFGYGLWNNIWGFVAVRSDFNTIQGVKFQHTGETPGLGARIESDEIQERYKEKAIFENGQIVSVVMMKGEGKNYDNDKHKVDGMSSATLTANGVNSMLADYLKCYEPYLKKNMSGEASAMQ